WPHQVQAAERHALRQMHLGHKWDLHYDWGLRTFDLDVAALANYRFAVRSLQARLPDGTLVSAPEDGVLSALDLRPPLQAAPTVTVHPAVPKLEIGKPNITEPGAPVKPGETPRPTRYLLDTQEVEDENAPDGPQPLQVRLLNFRLLPST